MGEAEIGRLAVGDVIGGWGRIGTWDLVVWLRLGLQIWSWALTKKWDLGRRICLAWDASAFFEYRLGVQAWILASW